MPAINGKSIANNNLMPQLDNKGKKYDKKNNNSKIQRQPNFSV